MLASSRLLRKDVDVKRLVEHVLPHVLSVIAGASDMRGCEGGVFVLIQEDTRELLVPPTVVGAIPDILKEACARYANEKIARLLKDRYSLSWQSRDPDNEQWGGAFNDGRFIWSFSGLSEEQDEAIVLMAAHLCGRVDNGGPRKLARISGNRIILGNPYLFWVPKNQEGENCPSCGGKGDYGEDDCCDHCGGSGKKDDCRVPRG